MKELQRQKSGKLHVWDIISDVLKPCEIFHFLCVPQNHTPKLARPAPPTHRSIMSRIALTQQTMQHELDRAYTDKLRNWPKGFYDTSAHRIPAGARESTLPAPSQQDCREIVTEALEAFSAANPMYEASVLLLNDLALFAKANTKSFVCWLAKHIQTSTVQRAEARSFLYALEEVLHAFAVSSYPRSARIATYVRRRVRELVNPDAIKKPTTVPSPSPAVYKVASPPTKQKRKRYESTGSSPTLTPVKKEPKMEP
jgi:hypothetical protein